MTTIVECPNCGTEFDAAEASFYREPCPGCAKTWGKLHACVDPASESEPRIEDTFENGFEVVKA